MSVLLALDPGKRRHGDRRRCGAALFVDGLLLAASHVDALVVEGDPELAACVRQALAVRAWVVGALGADLAVHEVASEWPRVYPGPRQEGDQNDLPPLAGVACAVGALFPGAVLHSYDARTWKGGAVDKRVMNDRVWERLSAEERARVARLPRGGLSHDCLDAVGVGLHHLGRLARRRVYA